MHGNLRRALAAVTACGAALVVSASSGGLDAAVRGEQPRLASTESTSVVAVQLGDAILADTWTGPYLTVSLSADGSTVAIGEGPAGDEEIGITRVLMWDGTTWAQQGGDIVGEAAWDFSGVVSLSGDGSRLAVGAPQNDGNGPDAGHVRVYDWDGTNWVQAGNDIDGEAPGDFSGTAVSISGGGDRLAIGAAQNDGNGENAGHVRIFDWDGSDWVQAGNDIDGEAPFDNAAVVALSADGSRVAIGAPQNDAGLGPPQAAGHVRVFTWDGSDWVQLGTDIDGDDPEATSGSSVSLSADGNRLAIGAPRGSGVAELSGIVRVYDWDGTSWLQTGTNISGDAAEDNAGESVALSAAGDRLVVGARLHDSGDGPNAGQVRIYTWDGSEWVRSPVDVVGVPDDRIGSSVALSADGTRFGTTVWGPTTDVGRALVFELEPFDPSSTTTTSAPPAPSTTVVTPTVPGGQLPETGASDGIAVLAAGVLALGAALVVAARRRTV